MTQPYPMPAGISQSEDVPKAWEFWGANERRLKAGISYRVTVAIEPVAPVEVDLVTETVLRIQLGTQRESELESIATPDS
ncbi:hypothetical protein [Microseira sp. BLCC-F43]|uniref:hypothetical protein n=1 Tax=Microseira sp. BLCC-F43 TaxID=3153602 RepID=UPI0035B87726